MNELPPVIRAFVAVPIPKALKTELTRAQAALKPDLREVSWTRPEAMHLTLHFFGNIKSARIPEIVETLARATSPLKKFNLNTHGIGYFGQRVLWAGLDGEVSALQNLAREIREAIRRLGFEIEAREFNPHITLGRMKTKVHGLAAKLAPWSEKEFGSFSVERVELIRSELLPQGSRYATLSTFGLS